MLKNEIIAQACASEKDNNNAGRNDSAGVVVVAVLVVGMTFCFTCMSTGTILVDGFISR